MINSKKVKDILGTYTDPIPKELIKSLKNNRCVLFVGSGISRRCFARNRKPLPNWNELINLITAEAIKCNLVNNLVVKELNTLISDQNYLIAAEELIEILGESQVHSIINNVLDPDGIVPSKLHEILAITPFRFCITTNYDNLYERAFGSIWNRNLEVVCVDELSRIDKLFINDSEFILKLHGDIHKPGFIVLGQKKYQNLLQNNQYSKVLLDIFKNNSVIMLGYDINDIDIKLVFDRLAVNTQSEHPHFLLCKQNNKTSIEKKRLAKDRNIHVIEYVDYFGYHNHIDTFFKGLNVALNNSSNFDRLRLPLRARIGIHYPKRLVNDGIFIWNLLFREGAVTLCEEAQLNQLAHLKESISDDLFALDYVIFIADKNTLQKNTKFLNIIKKTKEKAKIVGVQIIFVVIGATKRPKISKEHICDPIFYLNEGFSEKDLSLLISYISQDVKMGLRQD